MSGKNSTPIIVCGKTEMTGSGVIGGLDPDYEGDPA